MKWKDKMERVLLTFRLFRKYGIKTNLKRRIHAYNIKMSAEKYYIYEITKPSLKNLTQIHSFHDISKTKSQCFSYFSLQPPWNSYNACSQLPGRNTRDRGKTERISGRHERESRINLYLVFGSPYFLALFPASCFGGAHEETRPARKKGRDKKGPVRGFL